RQALRPSTTFCCTSKPSTRYPALASSTASGSPTYPSPTIPNSTSRRSALAISSSATLILSSSIGAGLPPSCVKLEHGLDHGVLLRSRQLRKHRERHDLGGGRLGHRNAAALVAEVSEAG